MMNFRIVDIDGEERTLQAAEYEIPSGEHPFSHARFYASSAFMERMSDSGITRNIPIFSIAIHRVAYIEVVPDGPVP